MSPVRPAAPPSPAAPPPRSYWAARRAPSWRRVVGPKVVVAPVGKTVRAVAFDVIAIAIGLGLGVAVVSAITFSGLLG